MEGSEVVIVSAVRTAVGCLNGTLAQLPAHHLGAAVCGEALRQVEVAPEDVDELIMGQVLTAGQGQNPARQTAVKAGLPYVVPAWGCQMVCASGLKSVCLGARAIRAAEACVVLAGGQENMSLAPHAVHMRAGTKMGNCTLLDTMTTDGLTDAFHKYLMGVTAENVAQRWSVSREDQDLFALCSQQRAEAAQNGGFFTREILPVTVPQRKGAIQVMVDEFPRHGCTMEKLSAFSPCFLKDGTGTVTAGNSTGVNDGAAAVLMMSAKEAGRRNIPPLARVISWAQAGVDPDIMGTGPIPAVRKALAIAGWTIEQVDLFELNEAFAAQTVAVIRELGIHQDKVNIQGGAIALGHPIGASGCRILVTLLHALQRIEGRRGVAALCVGGGMGLAMCVERDLAG
uniref:acetyl-CoA acetyltransferase, cytosolic isoform X1 n=2 Tax=Myxine glutinosa TaxID=7769 RepID=UPI00358E91BB